MYLPCIFVVAEGGRQAENAWDSATGWLYPYLCPTPTRTRTRTPTPNPNPNPNLGQAEYFRYSHDIVVPGKPSVKP